MEALGPDELHRNELGPVEVNRQAIVARRRERAQADRAFVHAKLALELAAKRDGARQHRVDVDELHGDAHVEQGLRAGVVDLHHPLGPAVREAQAPGVAPREVGGARERRIAQQSRQAPGRAVDLDGMLGPMAIQEFARQHRGQQRREQRVVGSVHPGPP